MTYRVDIHKFRDVPVGATFDWINEERPSYNSFYDRCTKTGPRTYSAGPIKYQVGSINTRVFHVVTE
jgi:hypothetical protein